MNTVFQIDPWLQRLQALVTGVLFFLIILGAAVRLSNAGLACPDWPLCNGSAIPIFNFKVFMEWIHRVVAMSVGIFAFVSSLWILFSPAARKLVGGLVFVSLGLFAVQAFLGRQTVTELLKPEIVNAHLMGGYLLFAVNLWIYIKMTSVERKFSEFNYSFQCPAYLKILLPVFLVFTFFQATVGGAVSSHYAGLICPDFPKCNGEWLPVLQGLVAVKFFHQLGAFILLAAIFTTTCILHFKKSAYFLRRLFLFESILVSLQIAWGVGMVFTQIHPGLSLLHSATSISIFALFLMAELHLVYSSENHL